MIQVGKRMRRARGAELVHFPATCVSTIERAIADLKEGRDRLRSAGAFKAADAVARAIKSAKGAHAHALRALPDRVEAGGGVR